MAVTVCVSASSTEGLTTAENFRAWLGVTSTCEHVVQQLTILRASKWVESKLGYPTPVQIYSEACPAYGTRQLMLSRTPVLRVLRLFDSTSTGQANSYTSSQFRVEDAEAGFITLVSESPFRWTALEGPSISGYVVPGSELKPWYVEYVAGWTPPAGSTATCSNYSTSTGPTMPADIEQAVFYKAREMYQGDQNVAIKRVGDLSINYAVSVVTGQPFDPALQFLQPYIRVTI